jgi:hypothetical protein
MRAMAMAGVWLCLVSLAAAQVPTVLGGVDVYRSTRVTSEWLESTHDTLLHQLVDALRSGRYEAVGSRIAELRQSLDAAGDIVYRDLGLTTSFETDTNRVWIMLDVVERADSATRLGRLRSAPRGAVEAAHEAVAEWQAYERRAIALVQARELSPVVAECPVHHCLLGFEHPELAHYRASFDTYAGTLTAYLARAVREDSAAAVRASALFVLAHARDAQLVASTAAEALDDPASAVRNNALRVLAQLTGAIPGGGLSDVQLPVERVLHALDDPSSTVRNKAALITASLAARPAYRDAVLGHGEALVRLLRLRQMNNHEPAHMTLQALSGQDFGARDYDAWERWLATARRSPTP